MTLMTVENSRCNGLIEKLCLITTSHTNYDYKYKRFQVFYFNFFCFFYVKIKKPQIRINNDGHTQQQ